MADDPSKKGALRTGLVSAQAKTTKYAIGLKSSASRPNGSRRPSWSGLITGTRRLALINEPPMRRRASGSQTLRRSTATKLHQLRHGGCM